jgi:hypothetical protein
VGDPKVAKCALDATLINMLFGRVVANICKFTVALDELKELR